MRYFIYCRKSTEAEDRQVASIESQLTTLKRTFGDRGDVEIVRVYEEAFSAKAPGRTVFSEMMAAIEKGAAEGIIAWAPDRLARNSVDGGRIVYLLDTGAIKDLKFSTYTFENNSQGKFMLQIMFGQSKYYSDALSENVLRGIRTKLEKGWRSGKAPLGYQNDPVTRTIVPDPERLPLIRQMFDLLFSGICPKRIWEIARNDWGFRTPRKKQMGDKLIALSMVYRILNNPFYAGFFLWQGQTYKGAHTSIITMEEYERAQQILGRPEKPRPHTRHFAFTGIIRCGECGLQVTAEEKVNRYGSHYTYYHCTRRRPDYRCRQRSLADKELEHQIEKFLSTVTLPERLSRWAQTQLIAEKADVESVAESQKISIRRALEQSERELSNLISLRLRELVDDTRFMGERSKIEQQKLRLQQELERSDRRSETFEPERSLISFSEKALQWFRAGDMEAKRLIFDCVCSNPILKDKTLKLEAKKPFRSIAECTTVPGLCGYRNEIRTSYANHDPELLGVLSNIKRLEAKFGSRTAAVLGRAA